MAQEHDESVWRVTRLDIREDQFELCARKGCGDEELVVSVRDGTQQLCCEDPGVRVQFKFSGDKETDAVSVQSAFSCGQETNADQFVDWCVMSVELVVDKGVEQQEEEEAPEVVITLRESEASVSRHATLLVRPFNHHNGYYPHNFVYQIWNDCSMFEVGKSPIDLQEVADYLEHMVTL